MTWYGDRDIFLRTNPPFTKRVKNFAVDGLDAGDKISTSKHQYYGGDILFRFTHAGYDKRIKDNQEYSVPIAQTSYGYGRFYNTNAKMPIAIFMIKRFGLPDGRVNMPSDIEAMLRENGFVNEAYYAPILVNYKNQNGYNSIETKSKYRTKDGYQHIRATSKIVPEWYTELFPYIKSEYNIPYGLQSNYQLSTEGYNAFVNSLNYEDVNGRQYPVQTATAFADQERLLIEKIGEDKYNDYKQRLYLVSLTRRVPQLNVYMCACQISASIPIFYMENYEEMYEYFVNDEKGGVNQDDLVLSEIDLATNWKIYVNGERNPSIYITMNSPGVDAFLSDPEKNTGGYKKNDFKVEYLTPVFRIKSNSPPSGFDNFDNIEEIQEPVETYDNMKSSSWDSMTDANYINKDDYVSGIWLGSPLNNYKLYAQNKFRLRLNENVFSTWCETGIGYIGSPMLEDFTKMNNWGSVLEGEITDGSTVEIIYNQLPPGIDDYDDPDDEIPSPDETAPGGYDLESVLTKTYKTDAIQMQELGKYLWGTSFIADIKLVNNNPIENLVGCKRMPVSIPAGDFENIVMGNVTTTANGQIVNNIPIIDVGSVRYEGYYKNFLDYSPYTRLILFLPFCGFTELDPSVVTGKTLSVKYAIDVVLGKCRAMLFVDDAYYASFDGNFGVDIPITSSNRAQVDAGLVASGISALAQVGMAPATNVATTAVSATMGGIESAVAAQYHSVRAGSYSSTCAWQETRTCFMIADIPTCQYPSSYAHDKGYPCQLTRSLSTMRGFTICNSDIDMRGFRCTEEEINMIREILTTGIYL